jgi:hypothetical protein
LFARETLNIDEELDVLVERELDVLVERELDALVEGELDALVEGELLSIERISLGRFRVSSSIVTLVNVLLEPIVVIEELL